MHKILLVAYHFPPIAGSSGYLRTLKFSKYLLDRNWHTTVLTVHPRAYERIDDLQLQTIPPAVAVHRSFAVDTQRHLAIHGWYPGMLALPDRWISWVLSAVPAGRKIVREQNIDVIVSTFPIASAVLIGYLLHRATGKPWVADFRDSMTEENYPADPKRRAVYRWIERKAVEHASRLIFTAESARRMYLERYPSLDPTRCLVIPNGYDEEDFRDLRPSTQDPTPSGTVRLLHAGLIYPWERDPRPFFRAISRLKREGKVTEQQLQVNLRASGNESEYDRILHDLQITDIVHLLPPISYKAVLQEAADSQGVLLFQAANCNHQIPAKAYEYIRIGRPIFALTDEAGDTASLLREVGGTTIVDIASEEAIYNELPKFISAVLKNTHASSNPELASKYSRRSEAYTLADVLDCLLNANCKR